MKAMTNKKLTYCVLAALSMLLAGCWQKSLHPFYHEKDLAYDAGLEGIWKDNPDQEKTATWTFSAAGDKKYKLNIVDGDLNADFEARLFVLEGEKYLDLYSVKRSLSEIPVHHLLRIEREGDSFSAKILNLEWVQQWVRENPSKLSHLRVPDPEHPDDRDKDEIVLAATTEQLQKFILEHRQKEKFFEGGNEPLKRAPQAVAKKL